MNIFYLDTNTTRCARAHGDKHVVKMVLESAQILCTVIHQQGGTAPYKPTHVNHPCVQWAGRSLANWVWLQQFGLALDKEYQYRFSPSARHQSALVIDALDLPTLPDKGLTPPAQAMPPEYQQPKDPVAAYRAYYRAEKRTLLTYTRRPPPAWLADMADYHA